MSLIDKIKSLFAGGPSADSHAGHDHSGHDHSHDPAAPVDPAGIPASEPEDSDSEARA
jgi:hypothetical protein